MRNEEGIKNSPWGFSGNMILHFSALITVVCVKLTKRRLAERTKKMEWLYE